MRTGLVFADIQGKLPDLVQKLFQNIPCGVGMGGAIPKLARQEIRRVLLDGARWAVQNGYGSAGSLEVTEEGGTLSGADTERVSEVAMERGAKQLGTLGSGNHFLEVDRVEEIYWPEAAARCGIQRDGVVFIIHSGSRGLGYQVCEDYLGLMEKAMR
ncbi:MAG: RtcB family protein, partial [Acidobacteria bacterium]|nr:RtcB family protein [Acidobacteriota bacterium]